MSRLSKREKVRILEDYYIEELVNANENIKAATDRKKEVLGKIKKIKNGTYKGLVFK